MERAGQFLKTSRNLEFNNHLSSEWKDIVYFPPLHLGNYSLVTESDKNNEAFREDLSAQCKDAAKAFAMERSQQLPFSAIFF